MIGALGGWEGNNLTEHLIGAYVISLDPHNSQLVIIALILLPRRLRHQSVSHWGHSRKWKDTGLGLRT